MILTQRLVAEHVGKRAMRRVRWYELDEPSRVGQRIQGRVAGFVVSSELGLPLTSRCSCLYRTGCEHAAVLLMAWVRCPESFEEIVPLQIQLPTQPRALLTWLGATDPELLEMTLEELLERGHYLPRSHPLWRWMTEELGDALEGIDEPHAFEPVMSELTEHVRRRRAHREALERARSWREEPPKQPIFRALWEAATAVFTEQDGRRAPGKLGSVQLDSEAEVLVFRARSAPTTPVRVPISASMFSRMSPFLRSEIAGVVLDSVIGPLAPEVREGVRAVLETPGWQKALARLDVALSLEGPSSSVGEASAVGWKVHSRDGRVDKVAPVMLTPYKTRSGFRVKKLLLRSAESLPLPADRAAHAALLSKGAPPLILEQLIDHPRVVDENGELLRVRRAPIEVSVRESGGLLLEIHVDGEPIPPEQLELLRSTAGLAVLHRGGSVVVVEVGPVLEGVADILQRYGGAFPRGARKPLMQRLGLLEAVVPMRLEGSLRGRTVPADLRPVVLLIPLSEGALRVNLRIRPLPGGPHFRPGSGPVEVARVQQGERRVAIRELRREPAQIIQALGSLPFPLLTDWDGAIEDPDEALDLVHALRQSGAQVEWPERELRVVAAPGSAKQLRLSAYRRRDWFGVEGELKAGRSRVRLVDLLAAIRENRRYVAMDDGGWVRLTIELQEALRTASAVATLDPTPRLPPLAAARALLELESAGVHVEIPDELRDHEARIRSADTLEAAVPVGLQATLRDYQLDGLTWLRRMTCWAPGAVLADEMGLGKTVQALAFLLGRADGPALVVSPASVNLNWLREAERFAPGLPVAMYRGPGREALLEAPRGLLITSYELMVRDLDRLCEVRFGTVVFDEAQALKNASSKRAKAARSLDMGFCLAMSGTPVENDLMELWSLMRCVAPGMLGPREHFMQRFGRVMLKGEPYARGQLGRLVRPFILRRTKAAVAPELPPREESVDWVELTGPERVVYERLRQSAVGALHGEGEPGRFQVLAALTRLRQAACAAKLIEPDLQGPSAKITRLLERIRSVRESGEAALVFSQFTSLLDLAAEALVAEGARILRLDGSTSMKRRQEAVDGFQRGEADVFLISLKAGGVGLNLTAATTVIHLDPWWNPAAEDQASDRAHRIGQDRPVQVIRLVAAGTVEEEVLALHAQKRELAAAVLEGTAETHTLRAEELLGLLEG